MAANDKKNVMGYDPLAWLSQDSEDLAVDNEIEDVVVEAEIEPEEEIRTQFHEEVVSEVEMQASEWPLDDAGVDDVAIDNEEVAENSFDFSESEDSEEADESFYAPEIDDEHLNFENDENEMNAIAALPESQVSEQDTETMQDIVESIINLDANLTIQNVVQLHEKIKKSYAANNAIQINASQVSSIDTASLQLLVALKKDAAKKQKEVVLSEPSSRFIESAELLGLLELLEIEA